MFTLQFYALSAKPWPVWHLGLLIAAVFGPLFWALIS